MMTKIMSRLDKLEEASRSQNKIKAHKLFLVEICHTSQQDSLIESIDTRSLQLFVNDNNNLIASEDNQLALSHNEFGSTIANHKSNMIAICLPRGS